MALGSEPVAGGADLPQIHPRQRNKTKYHIKPLALELDI